MKGFFLLFIVSLLWLSSCAHSAFESAVEQNNIEGYSQFLEKYPDSEWGEAARHNQEALLLSEIQGEPTLQKIRLYQQWFPVHPNRVLVNALKETLLIDQARASGNQADYSAYLHQFPEGEYATEAKDYFKSFELSKARESKQFEDYESFLNRYPQVNPEVKAEAEAVGAAQMRVEPSRDLLQRYRKLFPQGEHLDQVVGAFEEHQFIEAQKNSQIEEYEAFMQEFPSSRFLSQITKGHSALLYQQVKTSLQPDLLKTFLARYPHSRESAQAWGLLVQWNASMVTTNKKCVGCYLKGADLHGIDLQTVDLSKADLSAVNFSGANLSQSNLSGASLQGANFSKAVWVDGERCSTHSIGLCAKYNESDLKRLLESKKCPKCKLHGAPLQKVALEKANLAGADLRFAQLKEADLNGANLKGADLSRAQLEGANLRFANLSLTKLNHTDLNRSVMKEADLTGAQLNYTKLNGADMRRAIMNKVIFLAVELDNSDLRRAELREAQMISDPKNGAATGLDHADFRWAFLQKAQLNIKGLEVNFSEAHMQGVKFVGAVLGKTDFRGADLSGSTIGGLTLPDAMFGKATWSDGEKCLENSVGRCLKAQ